MKQLQISRRTALALIAAGVPASFQLSGCTSAPNGPTSSVPTAPSLSDARPEYHLTPPTEWINDPQRPLWINGAWNLWVLWNADYPSGNGTAWRRYTSVDLVSWEDQGVSIPKYTNAYGDVWTGSTVVDTNNTAGYGDGAVIALMTMACANLGGQSTALWYSNNNGVTFNFGSIVQTNPQIAQGVPSANMIFRDPNIFWYGPGNCWVMSLAEIGKLSIYTSTNLANWAYQSGMVRSDLGTMECPHLFKLHLYNSDDTITADKWVLLCGANGAISYAFTTGTAYWVGSFDGATFTPDSSTPLWLDGGPDFYAATVFADANASDQLAYAFAIAWENNWDYAASMQTVGYFGQLSIARQLTLQMIGGSPVLLNMPIAAQNNAFSSSIQGTNQTISDTVPYSWPAGVNGLFCRIDFTLSSVNGNWPEAIFLAVRSGDGYFTQIGFQPGLNNVFLNRVLCGVAPVADAVWYGVRNVSCAFSNGVSVSVFIDEGSIEVFLNGGNVGMSGLITPPLTATGLSLTTSNGSAGISNLVVRNASC